MRLLSMCFALALFLFSSSAALAQGEPGGWRPPQSARPLESPSRGPLQPRETGATALAGSQEATDITRVTSGSGTLPNSAGQVWREYDLRPYTSRVTSVEKPEQAIVDWILRETGTEAWFSHPLGILSATHDTLRVYHTPQMQRVVNEVVDRFVGSAGEASLFGVRVVSIGSPNWRARALTVMRPVDVQTPGVEAWLMSREDAAMLVANLNRRTDYREYHLPNLAIQNGQTHQISREQPRTYAQTVALREGIGAGYDLGVGQINEGYNVQFSPLTSVDGSTVDAVLKVDVHQIERLVPVSLDVPGTLTSPGQRVRIEVPQMVSWNLQERFRWPSDQVLIISGGMVAAPAPENSNPLGLANIFAMGSARADAVLIIEPKGAARDLVTGTQANPVVGGVNNRGRY